jgi:hypothetical protein
VTRSWREALLASKLALAGRPASTDNHRPGTIATLRQRTEAGGPSVQDTKLFETILGLQGAWHIARVELSTTEQRVDLWVEHAATQWPCPDCGTLLAGFDHAEERTWRHLDTCQFQTHRHAAIPRVQCPTHRVRQVRVPWAEPRSRFTLLMERLIIDLIQQCSTVRRRVSDCAHFLG